MCSKSYLIPILKNNIIIMPLSASIMYLQLTHMVMSQLQKSFFIQRSFLVIVNNVYYDIIFLKITVEYFPMLKQDWFICFSPSQY